MWITNKLLLYKEKPGVISLNSVWLLIDYNGIYIYDSPTLLGLLKRVLTEWRNDRHIVG